MPRYKVIYVTHYSEFLGANRALYELIVNLSKSGGVEPLVILPCEGEMSERLRANNIEYIIIKNFINAYESSAVTWKNFIKRVRQFFRDYLNQIYARRLIKNLLSKDYSLVHSNSSATNFGAYLAHAMGIPHIWHFRENWQGHFGVKFARGERPQFRIYDSADCVVAISEYIYEKFSYRLSPGKVTIIYDGIPTKQNISRDKQNGAVLNLCTVGLLHHSKQQLVILQALSIVIRQNTSIRLFIVGNAESTNPYYQTLKQFVDENGLQSFVEFTGYKPDAAEFIKGMDIGIIASKDEAFGRVTIEYMQAGLIPLGYNSGATPELIRDNENGFIFNSAEELADIITRLANDSALFEQIRKKAIESANDFSLSRTASQIAELYDQVLQPRANEDYSR